MQLTKQAIQEHNQKHSADHKIQFDFIAAGTKNLEQVMGKLKAFQVAIPSWAV